jgi:hypothetical protein
MSTIKLFITSLLAAHAVKEILHLSEIERRRERDGKRERGREREGQRERGSVFV